MRIAECCLVFALTMLLLLPALAQDLTAPERMVNDTVLVPVHQDAARKLAAGEAAAAQQAWEDACRLWYSLLEAEYETGVSTLVPAGKGRFVPVQRRVAELLAALPAEGRKVYQDLVKARADGAWRLAVRARDVEAVAAVARRFPWTLAAGKATAFAARQARAKGNSDREQRALLQLLRSLDLLPELVVSLEMPREEIVQRYRALAIERLDEAAWARSYRLEKKPVPSKRPVVFQAKGAGPVTRQLLRTPALRSRAWGVHRFPSRREGDRRVQRWIEDGANIAFVEMFRPGVHLGRTPTGSYDGGRVFTQDGQYLMAYGAEKGTALWRYEAPALYRVPFGDQVLHQVVAQGDVVYASLPAADPLALGHFNEKGGYFTELPRQDIFCLDAAKGQLKWRLAQGTRSLRGYSFPVAPRLVGKQLLVAGTSFSSLFGCELFAAQADSGELLWKRYLASGQHEMSYFGRPVRESVPSPVLVDGDNVVVSTNLGLVACVSRTDGSWRWAYQYPQLPIYDQKTRSRQEQIVKRLSGWRNQAPARSGDVVCVTPTDCNDALGLDLESGALRWRLARENRADSGHSMGLLNLAGAVNGRVLFSGDTQALAVHGQTGKRVWAKSVYGSTLQGVIDGDHWLLPSWSALTVLQVEDGAPHVLRWGRQPVANGNWEVLAGSIVLLPDGVCVVDPRGIWKAGGKQP